MVNWKQVAAVILTGGIIYVVIKYNQKIASWFKTLAIDPVTTLTQVPQTILQGFSSTLGEVQQVLSNVPIISPVTAPIQEVFEVVLPNIGGTLPVIHFPSIPKPSIPDLEDLWPW